MPDQFRVAPAALGLGDRVDVFAVFVPRAGGAFRKLWLEGKIPSLAF
jgi:hypothetical protein